MSIVLPDGRRLAYAECGDPNRDPVFLFHGLPGSRLQRHPDTAMCRDARLISVDRPGFGASDAQPNRRILDWPRDVAHLADHLGLDRFAVVAWSGGGPFGLACAYALPERVRSVVLTCSIAPLDDPRNFKGMATSNWLLFQCAKHAPFLLSLPVGMLAAVASWNGAWRLDGMKATLGKEDCALLEIDALREVMLADMTAALCQGYGAARREVFLLGRDWGFDLADVRPPVTILHGDDDPITPPSMARSLAERLPCSRLVLRRGEGHFLLFRHWRAVLRMALNPRIGGARRRRSAIRAAALAAPRFQPQIQKQRDRRCGDQGIARRSSA